MSVLKDQHILLDTCFLIKAYQYSETAFFNELFFILESNNCVPLVNDFIRFEFLRGCKTQKHIDDKNNFLDGLSGITLPITPDILEDAVVISNIYSNKNINPKQISIVDCYISAYLKKYSNNVVLLTLDNNDYPLLIHDRVKIQIIDTKIEILVLGFYKFNNKGFDDTSKEL